MHTLTQASRELFRRTPDEVFATFDDLWNHCQRQRADSKDRWLPQPELTPQAPEGRLELPGGFTLNDWSFSQLCRLAGVGKDTVNKVTADTAARVFRETLPHSGAVSAGKPFQVFTEGQTVRSVHGVSYTRLHNLDLLSIVREYATDFTPPQVARGGGTGLYCGEQDMFVFLIDPTGWAQIEGQAFAPGFFLWNSEVGRRSIGIQTFWFQAVCANHIVWDAVEVVDFSRKHTANVHDSLSQIRQILDRLVAKRDERRDGFVEAIREAMVTSLGNEADDVLANLSKHGISRELGKQALELAKEQGCFTVFTMVDALTRIAGRTHNAGDRTEMDQKASTLLAMNVGTTPRTEQVLLKV